MNLLPKDAAFQDSTYVLKHMSAALASEISAITQTLVTFSNVTDADFPVRYARLRAQHELLLNMLAHVDDEIEISQPKTKD